MLSIGKLGRGQENYYLSAVAQGIEDYYTGSGEAPGQWSGAGAARLGLSGEVDGDDLRQVLGGVDPRTGDKLGGHTRRDRVPGWDLTFSAPKSVSVLYALGADGVAAEVVDAHRAAAEAGIEYLERHATVTRRRVDGEIQVVRGEGLVVAAFRHRTSRAGDPQLHTHCLVANVVERVDGGWGAIHSPPIYQHARTAGFVYQAVLRGELTNRLGVEWGEIVNGYADIDGIDRRVIERFSKRRLEIEGAMAARGEDSPQAAQAATLDTRRAKDYDVDPETLQERWRTEAAELGAAADVGGALERPRPAVRASHLDAIADELLSARGLTAEHASFDRRDVMRGWCVGLPAGAAVNVEALEELVEGVLDDRRVLPVVDGWQHVADRQVARRADGTVTTSLALERRWSTAEMVAIEERLVERAQRGRRLGVGVVDDPAVASACRDSALSEEQLQMVRSLTTSGNGVDVVVGRAGTGKTYALAAAAHAWRAAGFQPIGVAIAARAAAELEASAGLPSTTVEQFLIDCDQSSGGMLNGRSVVVVDEAGMVDTRRLARLVAHVDSAGAKAVLVGDHHQLPAVEVGGAFAALVRRADVIELCENRRQVEEWERATLDQLRVGRGGRAGMVAVVDRYEGAGRLHVGQTPADVRAAMVADWFEARQRGEQPIMLALRRRDVEELNARARALLVEAGDVSREAVTVAGRPFSVGDRVVCLHNDRQVGVHNAMFGAVEQVEEDHLVVKVETHERTLVVPFSYAADGHLTHAYATTIHKAQGATYQRAMLLGDDRLYRQAGYTGLSRGRWRNDLYLVADDDRDRDVELEPHGSADQDAPAERLVRALGRDGSKVAALDERAELRRRHSATSTLAELWARRDALDVDSSADGTEPGEAHLDVRRLDRAIARRAALAGLAAEIDRPDHVVQLIGQPPVDLSGRERWRDAAAAVETYAARWGDIEGPPPAHAPDSQRDDFDALELAIDRAVESTDDAIADVAAGVDLS